MTTLTPEAAADWEAICRHPKMTAPCPRNHALIGRSSKGEPIPIVLCELCQGTGRVALLLEPCPKCAACTGKKDERLLTALCDGSGYIPKPFDALELLAALDATGHFGQINGRSREVVIWHGNWRDNKSSGFEPYPYSNAEDIAAAILRAARRVLEAAHA